MKGWANSISSNKLFSSIFLLLVLIATTSQVLAFGISMPYLEDNIIKLEAGQKYEYVINIQNGEDISFNVSLIYNSTDNVAVLRERDYFIDAKSYQNDFVFDIEIPNKARVGEEYILQFIAMPLIKNEGQIPLNIQIKRDVTIEIVDENGMGYQETIFDHIWNFIVMIFTSKFFRSIYVYLIILIVISAGYLLIVRFWSLSKGLSLKILGKEEPVEDDDIIRNSKFTISDAELFEDVVYLLNIIPNSQFMVPEIKELFSKKLVELHETVLSKKVLTAKSKWEILKLLK